jgi:hypothetical protein
MVTHVIVRNNNLKNYFATLFQKLSTSYKKHRKTSPSFCDHHKLVERIKAFTENQVLQSSPEHLTAFSVL